ncbi:MAG: GAF domain-containing protein [Candidatus Sericytochromatia bacterium]
MAEKLSIFYSKAEEIGGLKAKIKLSILTKVSSTQANVLEDTDELIRIFEESLTLLEKEFNENYILLHELPQKNKEGESPEDTVERLRKDMRIFTELLTQRDLFFGNVQETNKRVTEAIVQAFELERASTWLYDREKNQLECIDLYTASDKKHSSGIVLSAEDYPSYFEALKTEKTIAAHEAYNDKRTHELKDTYLKPLGIKSLLDVPIWVNGKMVGVICYEHVGDKRVWLSDEENFAFLMANFVSLSIENQSKN